jgi:hypothetical protein
LSINSVIHVVRVGIIEIVSREVEYGPSAGGATLDLLGNTVGVVAPVGVIIVVGIEGVERHGGVLRNVILGDGVAVDVDHSCAGGLWLVLVVVVVTILASDADRAGRLGGHALAEVVLHV